MERNKRVKGLDVEEIVSTYLQTCGISVLERNFYCPVGEIDIVGVKQEVLIFIEVKSLKVSLEHDIYATVNQIKLRRWRRTVEYWLSYRQRHATQFQLDFIGVVIDHNHYNINHLEAIW